MTPEDARSTLGVDAGATAGELRAAFLAAIRTNHPDTTAHPEGAGERTAGVIEAYRLLRELADQGSPPKRTPPPPEVAGIEIIGQEALWVGVDARAVAVALLEVADDLGEVSYVDRSVGLVQLVVRPAHGPTCWFTLSLHPRPAGTVVVATLESIEAAPTPPADGLLAHLAAALADRLGGEGPH